MKKPTYPLPFITALVALLTLSLANADDAAKSSKANSLGMKFVSIPAGEYTRGFDTNDGRDHRFHLAHRYSTSQSFGAESPAQRVNISRSFEMAVTEVTVAQFRVFVEATSYITDAERSGGGLGCFPDEKNYVDRFHESEDITWKTPGFPQSDNHPVVVVSWNDANAFCEWLSDQESTTYRLPTEAEWEYACRGGTSTWYSWGEDPDDAYRHANVADAALEAAQPQTTSYQRAVKLDEKQGDGVVFTASVGQYEPNAWGLYDMHGNVWEWCSDRWSADLYKRYFDDVPRQERDKVLVRDPHFTEQTDQHQYGDWRLIRGGAWTCAPAAVRCSTRTYAEAADATVYTGFRIVRDK